MDLVLFMLILMFAVFVQALSGFGGTLIAMPLGIALMGLDLTKPVMTIVAWITGVVVVAAEWKNINPKELLKMVGVMLVGVLGGLFVMDAVKDLKFLLIFYGVVVAGIGIKKLFVKSEKHPPVWWQNTSLGLAGIMQGLFVSGGSFLAVYSVEKLPEKKEFRATVNAVWAIINTVMITTYGFTGALTVPVLKNAAIAVVPTLVAIWLGWKLAKKVNQETFLKIIYVILIASGAVLLWTNL